MSNRDFQYLLWYESVNFKKIDFLRNMPVKINFYGQWNIRAEHSFSPKIIIKGVINNNQESVYEYQILGFLLFNFDILIFRLIFNENIPSGDMPLSILNN